ncbi:TPA: hypothetical protein JA993_14350 [Legionella pneumophila]|nr:hypothetical protein [Legionella pneumophila]
MELAFLNLSANDLHQLNGCELSQIFASMPKVGTLDLSGNSLFKKPATELMIALKALPSSVNALCLGENNLFF